MSGQALNSHIFSLFISFLLHTYIYVFLLSSYPIVQLHCQYMNEWVERHLLEHQQPLRHRVPKENQLPTPSSRTIAPNSPARGRAPFSMLGFCLADHGMVLCMLSYVIPAVKSYMPVFRNHFSTIVE